MAPRRKRRQPEIKGCAEPLSLYLKNNVELISPGNIPGLFFCAQKDWAGERGGGDVAEDAGRELDGAGGVEQPVSIARI